MNNDFTYINQYYGVVACLGRRVVADGKPGIIIGAENANIVVNLDEHKPGQRTFWHPTWNMTYLDIGKIRPMSAGQKRYQEYLNAREWFDGSFAEWLGVDLESKERREYAKRQGFV